MEPLESESYLDRVLGKDLVNLLKCSICLDYFTEPTILPCGHTFCYTCLKNIGEYQVKSAGPLLKEENIMGLVISCPTCRTRIYYGQIIKKDKGVVKSNYALSSVIESLKGLHERKQVDQSTNTETNAYCNHKMDTIQKNIDSVFEAVRMKGSVITEANKDIENIRKLQEELMDPEETKSKSQGTFLCENEYSEHKTKATETDIPAYGTQHFQMSQYSNVNVQTVLSENSTQLSSPPVPIISYVPNYHSSDVDPGYVDPAILSYGSSELNFQYGGNIDSNMFHFIASHYGQ